MKALLSSISRNHRKANSPTLDQSVGVISVCPRFQRFHFTFLSSPAQPSGGCSPCSLERCWLSAVTVNESSRQRTRSSTAHQFCTLARLRGLNGEPCR